VVKHLLWDELSVCNRRARRGIVCHSWNRLAFLKTHFLDASILRCISWSEIVMCSEIRKKNSIPSAATLKQKVLSGITATQQIAVV
jgi:hypothetical protein